MSGMTEERIREIIREELVRFFGERKSNRDVVKELNEALNTNKDGIRDELHKVLGTRGH